MRIVRVGLAVVVAVVLVSLLPLAFCEPVVPTTPQGAFGMSVTDERVVITHEGGDPDSLRTERDDGISTR